MVWELKKIESGYSHQSICPSYVSTQIDIIKPRSQFEIKVAVAKAALEGDLTDTIVVVTNSKNQPEVKILLYCIVKTENDEVFSDYKHHCLLNWFSIVFVCYV